MSFTTLVSGLAALLLASPAAAIVVRSSDICKTGPQYAYTALAHYPAAQSFCASAYAASTVTTTLTTTLTTDAYGATLTGVPTVVVTEWSTTTPVASLAPKKAKRSKCRKASSTKSFVATGSAPIYSANSTQSYYFPQSSAGPNQQRLCSSLISGPSSAAEVACSCYIQSPVTVTATSTATVSGAATATAQPTGTVTITTTVVVTAGSTTSSGSSTVSDILTTSTVTESSAALITSTSSTASESSSSTDISSSISSISSISSTSSTSTISSTSTATSATASASASAVSQCSTLGSTYLSENETAFSLTCDSLYYADDTNTISDDTAPSFESCLERCATTSGCLYLFYVSDEDYASAQACYLLSSLLAFDTGYPGMDTAMVISE